MELLKVIIGPNPCSAWPAPQYKIEMGRETLVEKKKNESTECVFNAACSMPSFFLSCPALEKRELEQQQQTDEYLILVSQNKVEFIC